MVNIEGLVPTIEEKLPSDPEYLSVGNPIFDRVRFNRRIPPKVGGSGGTSSRNPPREQATLFDSAGPSLPVVTTTVQTASGDSGVGVVDDGRTYWKRVLDAIRRKKPVKSTYEADMMGGQDSQGNTTTGYGGQVGGGSPPEV